MFAPGWIPLAGSPGWQCQGERCLPSQDLFSQSSVSLSRAVVKQRLQMFNSPYTSVLGCMRTVHRTEGFRAFYRSYTTQLTMNVPFQAIHFITYELLQERLNPHRQYNPRSHIVAGAVAGAVAAAATTPLDVCKTLLNTQENMALSSLNIRGHLSGMANAFGTVYQLGGLPGFFKGVQARVIYQMPSTAISWSVYEFFKYFLTKPRSGNLLCPLSATGTWLLGKTQNGGKFLFCSAPRRWGFLGDVILQFLLAEGAMGCEAAQLSSSQSLFPLFPP
uniref:Mitoferrin-1 n=1 Tax=Cyanistes caeruleus TaxID=156563 RepID=A0A8C0ZAB7_CYACU